MTNKVKPINHLYLRHSDEVKKHKQTIRQRQEGRRRISKSKQSESDNYHRQTDSTRDETGPSN